MNLFKVTMAGRNGTYDCGAARKKLGKETAVQGAVRGSGKFSPVLSTSPVRQDCKGKVAAAAMAQMEVFRVENVGKKKRDPAPLYIATSW